MDPSTYRKSLGIIGSYDDTSKTETPDQTIDSEKIEGEISQDMKLEDLLTIYDQEKLEYLSTFVGQVWIFSFRFFSISFEDSNDHHNIFAENQSECDLGR